MATLASLAPAPLRAATLSSIKVTAERAVIRADGVATTVISAQVYDDRGGFAPDGTRVRFNTTAGRFDASVVSTQNGVARATLTSADQPGPALVQVLLDSPGQATPTNITIIFSNDASIDETSNSWIHIDGDYTAYATDFDLFRVVQANGSGGKARITYHGMTISGDIVQVNLQTNIVTIRGNAKIVREGVTREYRDASYDLVRGTGTAQRLEDGQLKTFTLKEPKLEETLRPASGLPSVDPEVFAFEDLSNGFFTVVASTIAVEPNVALQFHNATIYGPGYKLKFKNYVMTWDQRSVYSLPLIGYGPSGPTFDLPYDYDVQTTTRGTLHLRHGAQVGSSVYSVRPGWSLDAIQTYNGPQSIDGTVEVDGIGRDDWSAQIHHSQRLDDRTTVSAFLQAPTASNLFLTTQVTRNYKTFQVNVVGSGARAGSVVDAVTGLHTDASGNTRGQITAQTFGKPIFDLPNLQYVLEAGISRQYLYSQNSETPISDTANSTRASLLKASLVRPDGGSVAAAEAAQGDVETQQLTSRVYTPPLPIAPRVTLTQSVTLGQNWVEGSAARASGISASGLSLLGTTTFTRTFGPLGNSTFAYNYAQTPQILSSGLATSATSDNAHHRVSLGVNFAHGQIWNLSFTGSRGLDIDQSSLLSVLGFTLGGPTRGSVSLNDTRASGLQYTDVEYRVTRTVLGHGYSLYYSTTYKSLQFDTNALTF